MFHLALLGRWGCVPEELRPREELMSELAGLEVGRVVGVVGTGETMWGVVGTECMESTATEKQIT